MDEARCKPCRELLEKPPTQVQLLRLCLRRLRCDVIPQCICCRPIVGGCAFVGTDGNIHVRLCCGHSNASVLIHEYIHAVRLCQARAKKEPLAKDCLGCIREELLSYVCAGFCKPPKAIEKCIDRAFTSCALAAKLADERPIGPIVAPRPGEQKCNEGEDPKAVKFVGCTEKEIKELKTEAMKRQLIKYVRDTYGDPPRVDKHLYAKLFIPKECEKLVPPPISVVRPRPRDPNGNDANECACS